MAVLPTLVFASATAWDFSSVTNILQPQQFTSWNAIVKARSFIASSTSDINLFPNYSANNGTTTNASSTNLVVSSSLTYTGTSGCLTSTGGLVSGTGAPCGSASLGEIWRQFVGGAGSQNYIAPTSTIGAVLNASSSISALDVRRGTTTSATSTSLNVSGQITGAGLATCSGTLNGLTYVSATQQFGCNTFTAPFGKSWEVFAGGAGSLSYLAPTTTIGIVVNASSSIFALNGRFGTTTYATGTTQYLSQSLSIGSTSPGVGNALSVVGDIRQNGTHVQFGSSSPLVGCSGCVEYWGNDNTLSGITMAIGNKTRGTTAYSGLTLMNDNANSITSNYGGIYLNNSGFNDASFGTANNVPWLLQLGNVGMGAVSIQSATTSPTYGYVEILTGGVDTANRRLLVDVNGKVGIGSSTMNSLLSVGTNGNGSFWAGNSTTTGATSTTGYISTRFAVGSTTPLSMLSVGTNGNGSFWAGNSTTTSATTTNLAITSAATGCLQSTNGNITSTGVACGSGGGATFGKSWEIVPGGVGAPNYLAPTTTIGIGVFASSTIGNGVSGGGLTINGTATTTGLLYVNVGTIPASQPNQQVAIYANLGNNNGIAMTRINSTAGSGANLIGYRAANVVSSPTATAADYELLELTGRGYDGSAWATASNGAFRINSSNTWTTTDHSTYLGFFVTPPVGLNEFEAMRLTGDGNLGIGTTTARWPLQIASTTIATLALSDSNAPTNQKHWLLSSQDNKFTIGTSTDLFASTTPAFSLTPGSGLFVGTTTNVNATGFAIQGTGYLNGLTASAGLQTGILCLDSASQVINESVACVASAKRYKKDIKNLDVGLDELMKLRPVSFKWKEEYNGNLQSNPNFNGVQYSLVAEEVQAVDPLLVSVTTQETTFEGVTYPAGTVKGLADTNHWNALFVKSIQELNNKIDNTKNSAKEKPWHIATILLGLYVIYNEYSKWKTRLELGK